MYTHFNMSTLKKGKLIVIEGGDGAGKSTQIENFRSLFGERFILTREPGGTEYAEKIRTLALEDPLACHADGITLFMLMWGSRAEHMNHLVIPSLEEGKIIVSDRFDSSTFAYNVCAQDQGHLKEYFWQTRQAVLGEYVPDLYIYLDLDPKIGEKRLQGRDDEKNHFDRRSSDFKNKVRRGFFEFFKSVPHAVIDATQTREKMFDDILEVLKANNIV
jgi:dTMP kinase